MKPSQIKTIVALLFCVAACAWFARSVFIKPSVQGPTTQTAAQKKVKHASIAEEWKSQSFIPLVPSDKSVVVAAIKASVGEQDDAFNSVAADDRGDVETAAKAIARESLNGLTSVQSTALMRTLSEHIAARSDPTPASYLALADHDPHTRWIKPTDDAWRNASRWSEKVTERTLGEDLSPREGLEEAYRVLVKDHGSRFVAVASGEKAMRLKVFRIRSIQQIGMLDIDGMAQDVYDYWYDNKGTAPALKFRVPRESLKAMLSREQSALLVHAYTLVETESGDVMNLDTIWYWNQSRRSWLCYSMEKRGEIGAFLCY